MDTKKLRQKILDLAIRGKLVPQDPNDEPASVLLERIKAEKEKLIKEGKIKKSKQTASVDSSPYQKLPFEIPESWELTIIGELFQHNTGKALNASNSEGTNLQYITTSNVYWDRFELKELKEMPFLDSEIEKCTVTKGDLLVCEGGDVGRAAIWDFDFDMRIQNHIHRLRAYYTINTQFFYYVLFYYKNAGYIGGQGIGIQGLSSNALHKIAIPLPSLLEQHRIVAEVKRLFALIDIIEEGQASIEDAIKQAKRKVLELAVNGKLCDDNSHYEKVAGKVKTFMLEELLDYEQPQAYIVDSTDYCDDYQTPILTAGKSFIIGRTNENFGICKNLPVIIFDDFTTDSKYVDFPFKVKSSAMKILKPKNNNICLRYIAAFMSITKLIGKTHKRYWISEYSKLEIQLPPYEKQLQIVRQVDEIFAFLDKIYQNLI